MRDEVYLGSRPANCTPLTPLNLLERALTAHPDRKAVIWGERVWTYAALGNIVWALARFLASQGVKAGDVVSLMCPNRPEMLAAHYAVPLLGAVINSVNTRLDRETVAYILSHSESRLMIADPGCRDIAEAAAAVAGVPFVCLASDGSDALSGLALLDAMDPIPPHQWGQVAHEWQPIALNYTSGTTSHPKGVVLHHRGAYLNSLGNVIELGFNRHSIYLWVLPMFHCNGWCHTWAITAAGGVHVCLERVDPAEIFEVIESVGVTHMACAPVVLHMLLNHEARALRDPSRVVTVATGGAAPTSALIAQMDALGFEFIHLYGLTESYGPSTLRILSDAEKSLSITERATLLARQGVQHVTANRVRLVDESNNLVPSDGNTIGEIVLQGNTLMAGYYRDPQATEEAFRNGVFHTGDLAVQHPDGQIEIKDRAKDVIISGGENISSLEVESVLHLHPAVFLAAVVAAPDPKWGEVPYAFIELKPGQSVTSETLRSFCREHLAHFKVPRKFVFLSLPRTATGKIKKFELRNDVTHRAGEEN
ncbi:AMP-binding protein [Rhizobium alvei]|uniref:AMP-binding protein n=1 Tax=Rhizobium alvei TaxID=1132659 RepID=A0ABT8YR08_9HYPH|nr:AMP-binding protein [Rhizobium alvei]MDO6966047.1 AMP-binding protein [Rhizobium alvei]